MKKYDLIYYWRNYLINKDSIDIKPNEYILKFSLINSYSRDFFCNWYSFKSQQEIIGFIKFVVIPSTYITKAFGKEEDTIFLDALEDYEAIEIIEESKNYNKLDILKEKKQDYKIINSLKDNLTLEKLKN